MPRTDLVVKTIPREPIVFSDGNMKREKITVHTIRLIFKGYLDSNLRRRGLRSWWSVDREWEDHLKQRENSKRYCEELLDKGDIESYAIKESAREVNEYTF